MKKGNFKMTVYEIIQKQIVLLKETKTSWRNQIKSKLFASSWVKGPFFRVYISVFKISVFLIFKLLHQISVLQLLLYKKSWIWCNNFGDMTNIIIYTEKSSLFAYGFFANQTYLHSTCFCQGFDCEEPCEFGSLADAMI